MYRFTRSDPQARARLKAIVLEQPGPPLRTRIGYLRGLGHNCAAIAVTDFDLQDLGYNTIRASGVAGVETFSWGAGLEVRLRSVCVLQE